MTYDPNDMSTWSTVKLATLRQMPPHYGYALVGWVYEDCLDENGKPIDGTTLIGRADATILEMLEKGEVRAQILDYSRKIKLACVDENENLIEERVI